MKDNKLIAEFMGFTQEKNIGWHDNDMLMSQNVYDSQDGNCFDELLFHTSWDWIMPVANEIIKSRDEQNSDWDLTDLKYALQTTNIELVYKAVVEFIKNQSNMENSNRLIAEFMEMTPCLTDKGDFLIKGNPIEAKYLPYTTSWDWIMPVVMKISRKIDKPLDEVVSRLTEVGSDNIWDVKSLHNAVVEFINNQNN